MLRLKSAKKRKARKTDLEMSRIGDDGALRPLPGTAGAAATATATDSRIKHEDDEKATDNHTPAPEYPVCDQAMDPTLDGDTEVLQVQVTDSEKIQRLMVSNIQLEDRVRELEELLCEARRDCDVKSKECEQEREAHSVLQSKYEEMEKTLIQKEELLKVSLAEAEEKQQKAVESIVQLEAEKSVLTAQVKTLRDTVQDIGSQLTETQMECNELENEYEREQEVHMILQVENEEMKAILVHMEELLEECDQEQEAHSILQSKYKELMKTLIQKEKLMKVTMAEAEEKQQKSVESIVQLEAETSHLAAQVKTLRDTMLYMGSQLTETHMECNQLTNECDPEQEAHGVLQAENQEMKKIHKEVLLQVYLAEAEEKQQKAVESIVQLVAEKSVLTAQVKMLRDTVQDIGSQLTETQMECNELENEYEREREAHRILQVENEEMKAILIHMEELLEECGREREAHSILQVELDEMKTRMKCKKKGFWKF